MEPAASGLERRSGPRERPVFVVSVGKITVEARLPYHAGARHLQRREEMFAHDRGIGFCVTVSTTNCARSIPSPEYAYREPGSKWILSLRSGSNQRQLAKPAEWLSSMRSVISLISFVALKVSVARIIRQRTGQIFLDRLVEVKRAGLDHPHYQRGEGRLAKRSRSHDGIRCERQLLSGVAKTVGLDIRCCHRGKVRHPRR